MLGMVTAWECRMGLSGRITRRALMRPVSCVHAKYTLGSMDVMDICSCSKGEDVWYWHRVKKSQRGAETKEERERGLLHGRARARKT